MDLDKLSLRPSEIDKNTGRIVLPKSQEELDRLSGRVPGSNMSTRVKAYMPGVQRPNFPQPGTVNQPVAASVPTEHPPFWQHPFYGILGFCALVAALPVGFFCATLVRENDSLKGELSKLDTQNAILVAQQKTPDPSYTLTALNQEMARIRNDVAELSGSGIEVYLEEDPSQATEEYSQGGDTPPVEQESYENAPPQAETSSERPSLDPNIRLISTQQPDDEAPLFE